MSSDKVGIIAAFVERLQRLRVEIEASENPGVQKWAELQTVRETLRDLKASYPDDADLSECENVVEELISLSGRQFLLNVAHDITERKRAEEAIREANERLIAEQDALKEKNIALREVLNQIDNGKKQIGRQIQSNIDRIVMPILSKLETRVGPDQKDYITLLRSSLEEITFPFVNKLEAKYTSLTPREVQICNMVRNGLTSKEIASAMDTSELTVRKQRKNIRRKLGISHDKINLSSFLQAM